MPMRSVPHRVVCLLGLDDGCFPRNTARDGDDLMLADPHVGDRDARTEDRQLLLDALLAATDRLIVTYEGRDERTNARRPPAVPVGELLDAVERTVRAPEGEATDRVVVRHPLQPFDRKNFTLGELAPDRPWSFDRVMLAGARARGEARVRPGSFLASPLPDAGGTILEIEDLVRFVQHPVRAFLRQRLGFSLGDFSETVEDSMPVELDALEAWDVGERLLEARLGGVDLKTAVQAEMARGTLPPGRLAVPVIEEIRPRVDSVADQAEALLGAPAQPGSVDVRVSLEGGRTLSGTVRGTCGDTVRAVTYSRVSAKHRLAMWVRWLAVTAAHPERAFTAVTVGRARRGAPRNADVTIARLPVLGSNPAVRREVARRRLAVIVDLYDRGMREPLPIACLTSAAYAEAAAAGKDAEAAGRAAWESDRFDLEDREPEHQLILGGVRPFRELLDEPPTSEETGEGWDGGETSRFGRYARRLWADLLAHEEVSDR